MKTRNIIVTLLLFAILTPVQAQKRKATQKAPVAQPVVVEETPAQRLFKTMLPATAKVLFVDSIVVEKSDFLNHIPLSRQAGTISTYEQFFDRAAQVPLSVFQNEFGDRCYYADGDTLGTALYSIDRLGTQWSKPRELTELGAGYRSPNYPFLMSDGMTLFFAAKGEHSIGGYDIFMTLYDSEEGRFYRPENYGLPFNSTANDYLLAIDELNELGYLVSDRYQPSGKVCIYTFVPQFPRISFEGEDISDNRLRRLARLNSISETWSFGNRAEALQRYQNVLGQQAKGTEAGSFSFVINDGLVYHQLKDFHSPQSRQLYKEYAELESTLNTDKRTLDMQRDKFANASAREQRQMRDAMLRLENQISEALPRLQQMAKEIRYIENRVLQ
ncbi:MAG: hypothetical protein IKX25_07195 [Bacteroidales bacterium]|nr:hypothetical protein [Bacteroidales bacterium]